MAIRRTALLPFSQDGRAVKGPGPRNAATSAPLTAVPCCEVLRGCSWTAPRFTMPVAETRYRHFGRVRLALVQTTRKEARLFLSRADIGLKQASLLKTQLA